MRNLPKIVFSLNFLYLILIAAQVAAIVFLCLYIPAVLPLAAAYAGVWLTTTVTAAILLVKVGQPEAKCAWFVLIAALPVAGAVIYLVAASKRRICGIPEFKYKCAHGDTCAPRVGGTAEIGYDDAQYFPSGEKFFESFFADMEKAKISIYVEFFIICRGRVFDMFVEAVKRAKSRGAEIKILSDGVGSAFKLSGKDIRKLKNAGAEVRVFHRITPFPRARLNFRDHRKIITLDGKTAYTGGVNLADEYANLISPYGFWKDTGVVVRGAAAKAFEAMFLSMWNGKACVEIPDGGKERCLTYCDSPPRRSFCEDLYAHAINSAVRRVHIFTPYFCVSDKLASALSFAALRGVDVKVILPHIPDKPYAFELSKAFALGLKGDGVQFFEYTPGFLHAKALICDEKVFLGSYNFDFRSMHQNYECGISFVGNICDEAERDFCETLALCSPLGEGRISPAKRFSRFLLKLFAPLM